MRPRSRTNVSAESSCHGEPTGEQVEQSGRAASAVRFDAQDGVNFRHSLHGIQVSADLDWLPCFRRTHDRLEDGHAVENLLGRNRKRCFADMGRIRGAGLDVYQTIEPEMAAMASRHLKWFFNYPGARQWWRNAQRHPHPTHFEAIIDAAESGAEPEAA